MALVPLYPFYPLLSLPPLFPYSLSGYHNPRLLSDLFSASFSYLDRVISAKLTIDPVENSTNYYDVTVTVKSYVAKCLVVSEDLWVMVSGEREEKYPHK